MLTLPAFIQAGSIHDAFESQSQSWQQDWAGWLKISRATQCRVPSRVSLAFSTDVLLLSTIGFSFCMNVHGFNKCQHQRHKHGGMSLFLILMHGKVLVKQQKQPGSLSAALCSVAVISHLATRMCMRHVANV
jgi:hypothetical protein